MMSGCTLEIAINSFNERIVITRFIGLPMSQIDDEAIKQEVNAILDSLFVNPSKLKDRYIVIKVMADRPERTIHL